MDTNQTKTKSLKHSFPFASVSFVCTNFFSPSGVVILYIADDVVIGAPSSSTFVISIACFLSSGCSGCSCSSGSSNIGVLAFPCQEASIWYDVNVLEPISKNNADYDDFKFQKNYGDWLGNDLENGDISVNAPTVEKANTATGIITFSSIIAIKFNIKSLFVIFFILYSSL